MVIKTNKRNTNEITLKEKYCAYNISFKQGRKESSEVRKSRNKDRRLTYNK